MKKLVLIIGLLSYSLLNTAQAQLDDFFSEADQFLKTYVQNNGFDYQAVAESPVSLNALTNQIANANLSGANAASQQAFYINAYNILVVNQVIKNYPLKSVLDVNGFFDRQKFKVAGESITLNQLEKERLLKTFKDARFHFVLVCGALDCPPIINEAYTPAKLESQLERQTRKALNNPNFIKVKDGEVALSQIFEWYAGDFGGSKSSTLAFINRYRQTALPSNKFSFYNYNWNLNDAGTSRGATTTPDTNADEQQGNSDNRYVVSAAIPKGGFEVKGFSNLYTQETGNSEGVLSDQATFFTQNLSVLYGFTNRFNAGFNLRYRQVNFGPETNTRFDVFNFENDASNRQGLTGIGPMIRYAPSAALPNFSIQSTYWIATADDLAGTSESPFIDFNGDIWFTQIFNDFTLNEYFSLFTELDILIEDIGPEEDGHINRFSTPVQTIFSFFPNPKTTIYALGSYSPYWQEDYDYFYQGGFGAKYQITPQLEVELLYTAFRNSFIRETNGRASTLNLGIRISTF
jgi:hypothetical protein